MCRWLVISIAVMGLGCNRNSSAAASADNSAAVVEQPCKVKLNNLQWDRPKSQQASPTEQARRSAIARPAQDLIDDRK